MVMVKDERLPNIYRVVTKKQGGCRHEEDHSYRWEDCLKDRGRTQLKKKIPAVSNHIEPIFRQIDFAHNVTSIYAYTVLTPVHTCFETHAYTDRMTEA